MLANINDMLHIFEQYRKHFTSTKFENFLGLFLPSKNITKSRIYKTFLENNQQYILRDDLFMRITITGRLLTQKHKDILECIFTNIKGNGEFNLYKDKAICQIVMSPYNLRKSYTTMSGNETKINWIYEKLTEISNCGVELHFKNNDEKFYFTFIDSIYQKSDKLIVINFSQAYTYFLAKTLLLEYTDYVKPLLEFSDFCKKEINPIRALKREVHTEPIKAILRYMLTHKGNNSQYKLDSIFEQLQFEKTLSKRQLSEIKQDLKETKIQDFLIQNFGITLTNNNETLSYNQSITNKAKSILPPQQKDIFTLI